MTIAQALAEAAHEANWTPTRVALEAGVTEGTARNWLKGNKIPGGDKLESLRRALPGLAERLNAVAA
jgi:transcriptional regulator with XRE-family HTH domain